MTLVQIVENPITVAIDDASKSLADNRHGLRPAFVLNRPFLATSLRRPNSIIRSSLSVCAGYVVAALKDDGDMIMS
jgi:hypothetical protein